MNKTEEILKQIKAFTPIEDAMTSRLVPFDRSVQISTIGGPNLRWLCARLGLPFGPIPLYLRKGISRWLKAKGDRARTMLIDARLEELVNLVKDFAGRELETVPKVQIFVGSKFSDYLETACDLNWLRIQHTLSQVVENQAIGLSEILNLEKEYNLKLIEQLDLFTK